MSTTRTRRTLARTGAVLVLACLALAGCGASNDAPQSQSTASAPAGSDTAEPTDQPTPSAPATSDTATASASSPATSPTAQGSGAALLGAAELPQLNDSSTWTVGRTGAAGTQAFGLCQKFDLLTIGATSARERTYSTSAGDTAAEQVAVFPDAQNAVRAGKVLEAWHNDCAKRVRRDSLQVRPITPVAVSTGTGWWYLASYERGGQGYFHSFGIALHGTRMALVRMDHAGQDHNYPAGQDPTELALKAVSGRLG